MISVRASSSTYLCLKGVSYTVYYAGLSPEGNLQLPLTCFVVAFPSSLFYHKQGTAPLSLLFVPPLCGGMEFIMNGAFGRRIWICFYESTDISYLTALHITNQNQLIGTSRQPLISSVFSRKALIPAMQAAIRGDLDLLLVENESLLGKNPAQIEDTISTLMCYGVSVRSCNNSGRINS